VFGSCFAISQATEELRREQVLSFLQRLPVSVPCRLPVARRSIEDNRNFPIAHILLGVALALLGKLDEARAAARAGW